MPARIDSAERGLLLRALGFPVAACTILGGALGYYLSETRSLSGVGVVSVAALGSLVGALIGLLVYKGSGMAASGMASILSAGGNLPSPYTYSLQEAFLVRGDFPGAAESYRAHLLEHPNDHVAALALARLYRTELGRPEEAERTLRGIRRAKPGPAIEAAVLDALVALHLDQGERGKAMTELARAAEMHRGTPLGESARHALRNLKSEGPEETLSRF